MQVLFLYFYLERGVLCFFRVEMVFDGVREERESDGLGFDFIAAGGLC